jgi:hypothetical protein
LRKIRWGVICQVMLVWRRRARIEQASPSRPHHLSVHPPPTCERRARTCDHPFRSNNQSLTLLSRCLPSSWHLLSPLPISQLPLLTSTRCSPRSKRFVHRHSFLVQTSADPLDKDTSETQPRAPESYQGHVRRKDESTPRALRSNREPGSCRWSDREESDRFCQVIVTTFPGTSRAPLTNTPTVAQPQTPTYDHA